MIKLFAFVLALLCLLAIAAMIGAHFNLHPLPSNAIADRIRVELADQGIILEDSKDGIVRWKRK